MSIIDKIKLSIELNQELSNGGEWLGTCRRWLQSNVPRGDTLTWSSTESVKVPFYKFEELAKEVAVEAILGDREKQAKLKVLPKSLEQQCALFEADCKDILEEDDLHFISIIQDYYKPHVQLMFKLWLKVKENQSQDI